MRNNEIMIKPTIGRRVWFWPNGDVRFTVLDRTQALDAGVVFVHSDTLVNLLITDHIGKTFDMSSVTLVQPGQDVPDRDCYCTWMPYQKAQAELHADDRRFTDASQKVST